MGNFNSLYDETSFSTKKLLDKTYVIPKINNNQLVINKDLINFTKSIENLVRNYDCVIYYFDILNKNNINLINKINKLNQIVELRNKTFLIISDFKYEEIKDINIFIKKENYISPFNYDIKYGNIYKLPIGEINKKLIDFKIPLDKIIEDISNQYGFDYNKIILLSNIGNLTNLDLKIGLAYFE
jgi:hypothetical protein